jgi:L-threonylcarbamoyladenylate synthase
VSRRFRVGPTVPVQVSAEALLAASRAVLQGGVVVAPTDTCYGLMVSAANPEAVRRLFELKDRPRDKPVAVLLARKRELWQWGQSTPLSRELARRFLPGPLTLILSCRRDPVPGVVGPGNTVGVRVPNHPAPRLLCSLARTGLAASSANRSGCPSPTCGEEAAAMWQRVPGLVILDAGPLVPGGVSTVVDARADRPLVMREGMLSGDALTV